MHIVIDAHLAVKKIDGVARYLIGLLRELPKLDRSITFTVLALPEAKSGLPDEIIAAANVERVKLDLMGPSPKQHFLTPRLLKELQADLYHHPQYDLPFGLRIPTVVTIHDLKFIFNRQFLTGRSWLKSTYMNYSMRYALHKADRIIAVSENTRRDIEIFLNRPPTRTTVIHHGVDSPVTTRHHNKRAGLDIQADFILFVGTRRPHKNIEGLIQAVNLLRKQKDKNIDLVVAGKSYSDYTGPEKLVEHLDLQEHVHFLDFVPDAELPALYDAARVVVLPSFYEGFGFPILEAMARGKPVAASNLTSLPEIIGDAGLLFDPRSSEDIANKIEKILTSNTLHKQLSLAATKRAETFSWQKVAESTLAVYEEALSLRRTAQIG